MICCVELLLMFGKHLWTEALVGIPMSPPEEHLSELSADAPQIWIHQEVNKETWIYSSARCQKLMLCSAAAKSGSDDLVLLWVSVHPSWPAGPPLCCCWSFQDAPLHL